MFCECDSLLFYPISEMALTTDLTPMKICQIQAPYFLKVPVVAT